MSRHGAKEFRIKLFEVLAGTDFEHLTTARPWCETRASGYRIKLQGKQLNSLTEFYELKAILDEGFHNQNHAIYYPNFITDTVMVSRRTPGDYAGLTIYIADIGKDIPMVMLNAQARQLAFLEAPVKALVETKQDRLQLLVDEAKNLRPEEPVAPTDEERLIELYRAAKLNVRTQRDVTDDATGVFSTAVINQMQQETLEITKLWSAIGIEL